MAKDSNFFETARKRFKAAKAGFSEIREEAAIDLRMISGDQWDPVVKNARDKAGRPALTFNRLPNLVQHVANQVRQNTPAIYVNPVSDGASQDTADVFEGIVRHINFRSHGEVARDHAVECSASGGFGFYRICTEFIADTSFDQEILIQRILDPMTVYFDPDCQEPDYSDAKYCFVRCKMKWSDYKRQFPGAVRSDFDASDRETMGDWQEEDHIWIAEYWHVDISMRTLCHYWIPSPTLEVPDGVQEFVGWLDELPKDFPKDQIVQKREVEVRSVHFDKINGVEALDKTDWVGRWIPILPVLGKEMVVDGKRQLQSLIRHARDPQKLFNAYKSGIAENLGLASRVPWIGAKGSFKDPKWDTANSTNHAYLEYEPQSIDGQPTGPPARNNFEAPIQALSQAAAQESDDIKAAAGIFDSSLGAATAEYSGISVLRRQQQSDVTNFHFTDNLTRTMWHEGRILIDLIPKIYSTARAARILQEDGTPSIVMITQALDGDEANVPKVPGHENEPHHRLDVGRYDVTVTTGPSYTTQRQETFDMLTKFAQAMPAIFEIGGDIIFKNSDIPGARELAERFKLMLPQPILAAMKSEQQNQIQVAQQLAQMTTENEQLKQGLMELLEEKKSKILEITSKERVAALQAQTQVALQGMKDDSAAALGLLKTGHEAAVAQLEKEMETIGQRVDQMHEEKMARIQAELKPEPKPAGGAVQ